MSHHCKCPPLRYPVPVHASPSRKTAIFMKNPRSLVFCWGVFTYEAVLFDGIFLFRGYFSPEAVFLEHRSTLTWFFRGNFLYSWKILEASASWPGFENQDRGKMPVAGNILDKKREKIRKFEENCKYLEISSTALFFYKSRTSCKKMSVMKNYSNKELFMIASFL